MSKGLTRTYSLRKHIRPIVDTEEEEDDDHQRRDAFGRKRVDVIDCLLESSSDENGDQNMNIKKSNSILWLTLEEIRHIRYVLTRTNLSYADNLCVRCRKKIYLFFFLPLFLQFTKHEICYICQQIICKKCAYSNFLPPSPKLTIPTRIQTLIKPSSTIIESKIENKNTETKTVCYDCLQIFNEHIKTTQHPTNSFRRTFSLPPMSKKNPYETRHRRPLIKLKV